MSRELCFWKYIDTPSLKDSEIYTTLSNGEFVAGIAELPISNILISLDCALASWNKTDGVHYENGRETIELYTTSQFVRFDCYQVSDEHMNVLIDIMLEYDCPLYDSAIEVRFG